MAYRTNKKSLSYRTGTNKGSRGTQETLALPAGVLKSRSLNSEEYTVQQGGAFATRTIANEAFDNTQTESASHLPFQFHKFHYGDDGIWHGSDQLNSQHAVLTAEMTHRSYDLEYWRGTNLAVPQKAEDIGNIEFHTVTDQWQTSSILAESIYVEPYTVEGFQTHRVFGEFLHNKGEEDESRVAYSVIIGARPNRQGDGASILYAHRDCCNNVDVWSGVRFELLEGSGGFAVPRIGIQTLAPAENIFVESHKHFIEFEKPLEEGDRVSIVGTVTTTKKRLGEQWGCCEEIITIPQAIMFDFLRQGHTRQDVSPMVVRSINPNSPNDVWEDSIEGIRVITLSATGLEIQTGFWWGEKVSYRDIFGSDLETTWDIDIEEIEIISRT